MLSKLLRAGRLSAALAFISLPALAQTDPRMTVAWDLVEGAVSYRLQTTVGSLPFATAIECVAPPCTITGIEGTTTYKIQVAGLAADGTAGNYSEPISFMFASVQPLSPASLSVSNVANSPGKKGIKLSWPAVTKYRPGTVFPAGTVVEYRVYQAGTGGVVTSMTKDTFWVVQLQKNKSFHFYVTCVVSGVESFSSPSVRIHTN